jgi:hypothetical protein
VAGAPVPRAAGDDVFTAGRDYILHVAVRRSGEAVVIGADLARVVAGEPGADGGSNRHLGVLDNRNRDQPTVFTTPCVCIRRG